MARTVTAFSTIQQRNACTEPFKVAPSCDDDDDDDDDDGGDDERLC